MTDLVYRTAAELLRGIATRQVRSRELLEQLVDRIERVNPAINAVVALDLDYARARADAADAAIDHGERWGPLHGLPITIKDSLEVVGMPTTCGAPEWADHRPLRDADAVARLRAAGAIPFGKTNLPIYAGDAQSYNEVYGTTHNPWEPTRVPGGSSGGSAAALACGFTPLELGSDIGGSIRNPAHFCGVYGHKPSYGIVSMRGHLPGPPGTLGQADLAVVGPLARSPRDLELALDVLAGPDERAGVAWRLELPPPRAKRVTDFRVGVWLDEEHVPLDPEVADRIDAAVDAIERAGARVDRRARPDLDVGESWERYQRLLAGVMGAGYPPEARRTFDAALEDLDGHDVSSTAQTIRGTSGRHRDWLRDDERRMRDRAAWAELFRSIDVLLCPVMPTPAFEHDHRPFAQRTLSVAGKEIPYLDQIFWAGIVTLAALPSTVVPVGLSRAGLPIGMQVVGPPLEDRTPLAFARAIEDVVGGFVAPPSLDG